MELEFTNWYNLSEMAARRSFERTLGKFQGNLNRPVAVLTAFRQDYDLKTNRQANEKLKNLLKTFGLSFYKVIGAGQKPDKENPIADEKSFIVQPIDQSMPEEEFLNTIRSVLYSPTGDGSTAHAQWGALVKLPNVKKAFLLHHEEPEPTSPEDYKHMQKLGKSARPARGKAMDIWHKDEKFPVEPDNYFTQMLHGPKASDTMKGAADLKREKPPGRRFTISKTRFF